MAFDVKTSDAEARLYKKLDDIETLKKSIVPELVDALKGNKAYEGTITALPQDDMFRIVYSQLGSDAPSTIINVKFASSEDSDYEVTWMDRSNEPIHSETVGRPDLVDMIESMIAASLESNEG